MTVDFAAIRARADQAGLGPWTYLWFQRCDPEGGWAFNAPDSWTDPAGLWREGPYGLGSPTPFTMTDAEFIAHARADLPALLDMRDAALEVLAAYDRSGGAAVLKEWEGADWIEEIRSILEGGAP